jgi:hypothetical protein
VFDNAGRLVARPFDAEQPAGRHELAWAALDAEGNPLPPGVYFCRLLDHASGTAAGRKFVLAR